MREIPNLRIPGPPPGPADVLEAVARPMVDHRGREFAALIGRVAERLKGFYLAKEDGLPPRASGTGGRGAAEGVLPDERGRAAPERVRHRRPGGRCRQYALAGR